MNGIVADVNVLGHLDAILEHVAARGWQEYWDSLGFAIETLAELGLAPDAPDNEVWRATQAAGFVLFTANRNHDGPDSLEAVMQTEGTEASLPVVTVANAQLLLASAEYRERVIQRLLEILTDIDALRGSGRLYVP